MKTTPGCTVGVLLHCVSTVSFYTKSSSHEVSVGYKLVFAILSYNKALLVAIHFEVSYLTQSSQFMIPAFHDYPFEPKMTKCGELLYKKKVFLFVSS